MHTKNKFVLLCLSTIFFSGCFGDPTPVPQDSFYTLPDLTATKTGKKFNTLSVDIIRATGVYNERAVLYLEKNKPLSIKRYHYHHWVMPPSQLIQQKIKQYLSASGIAGNVMTYRPSIHNDAVIKGTLLQFERVLDNNNIEVRLAIELELIADSNRFVKRYATTQAAINSTFEASATAFGSAIEKIMQQFVRDIEPG